MFHLVAVLLLLASFAQAHLAQDASLPAAPARDVKDHSAPLADMPDDEEDDDKEDDEEDIALT